MDKSSFNLILSHCGSLSTPLLILTIHNLRLSQQFLFASHSALCFQEFTTSTPNPEDMLEGYKTYPGPGQRKKTTSPTLNNGSTYYHRAPGSGRELPKPPAIPPPDYMEAMKNRNTFGRPVTRHQSAREPMVNVGNRR